LFAPGGGQRIESRFAVVGRRSPPGGDPATIFKALQRGIKRAVLYEEFLLRCLLDGSGDALPMLRAEDQGAQNEQVEGALEQFQALRIFLGRQIT
jgi:hypothetical protein